jgi:antirestriction protein
MQAAQVIQSPQSNNSVYVGTYGKYNAGSIAGAWFDLEDYADYDDFIADCLNFHSDEADPELMFQDWQCELSGGYISETYVHRDLWKFFDLEDYERKLVVIYSEIADIDLSMKELIEQATDRFAGAHDDHTHFVIEYLEDMGFDFDALSACCVEIDYEGTWRNLEQDYCCVRVNGYNYYFRSH